MMEILLHAHAAHDHGHGHHHTLSHHEHIFHVKHPPPVIKENKKLSAEQRVQQEGLQQGIYLTWIKSELDNEGACLELPFTIVLLISFSCLAIMHLKQERVYGIEEAIEFDLVENANFAWAHAFGHKGIYDVNAFVDFWSWLRTGFVPLVVQQAWAYSESSSYSGTPDRWHFYKNKAPGLSPLPVPGDYLHYNRIVGGLRFRQEVAEHGHELCRQPGSFPADLWKEWNGKPCTTTTYSLTPDTTIAENWIGEQERMLWMFTDTDSLDHMLETTMDMEEGCFRAAEKNRTCLCEWCAQNGNQPWLDEFTQRIQISMATYNPEYGLVTMSGVNFFIDRAGFLHKFVTVQSAWADPFAAPLEEVAAMLICDFIWLGCLSYVFIGETREIYGVIKSSKTRWYQSVWEDYAGFWNLIDWLSILVAAFCVTLFGMLQNATGQMNDRMQTLMSSSANEIGRSAYTQLVADFYDNVESMCACERIFRLSLCLYPMIVMMRLFKSFAAQPRLAVVTATLVEASQDMIHFFIVFTSVYICMAVDGILLFGQDVEDFATFDRSFHTCFRAMFGDWDWSEMEQVGRIYGGIWFWLFVLIMVNILLNMLLAVIMDAYSCVKANAGNAQTLAKQISEMVRRRRQFKQKQRVRLNDIWDAFFEECGDEKELLASENIIRPADVLAMVQDIPASQAKRTMKNALEAYDKEQQMPYTLDEALESLKAIEKQTDSIRDLTKGSRGVIENLDGMQEVVQQVPNDLVVGTIKDAVSTLNKELETVLNGEMKFLEERQTVLEERQGEMIFQIKEMRHTLKLLHNQGRELAQTLVSRSKDYQKQREAEKIRSREPQRSSISGCQTCMGPSTAQASNAKEISMCRLR